MFVLVCCRLSFKHAGGVFELIGIGVGAALGVLLIEWIIYKFLVPILRRHRRHGRWRYIMFISQVHTHTLSLILMIIQTPRQTEIHHVHQSGTHTYSLFNTHDNTDATADGDTSCSSVRYTHIHSLFNTHDNTDATADGDTSCSSVRYTHTLSL